MDYQLEQWVNSAAGHSQVVDALMVALARWSEVAFIALVVGWLLGGLITPPQTGGRPRWRRCWRRGWHWP